MAQERNPSHSSYRQFPQPPLPTQYPPTQAVPATQQLFGQVPHLCVQDSQSMPPPPLSGILEPPTGLQTHFAGTSSVMVFEPQGHIDDFAWRQYEEWPASTGYRPPQNVQVTGQQSLTVASGPLGGPTLRPWDVLERARYATMPILQTLAPNQGSGQNGIIGPVAEPNSHSRFPDISRKIDDVIPYSRESRDQTTPSITKRKAPPGAIDHMKAKRSKAKGTAGVSNGSKNTSAHEHAHTSLHESPRPDKKAQDQHTVLASPPQINSDINTSLSIAPDFAEFLDDNGKPWIDTLMPTAFGNQESPTVYSSGKRELSPGWNDLIEAGRANLQPKIGIATCQSRVDQIPHLKRRQPQPLAGPSIQTPTKVVIKQSRPPAAKKNLIYITISTNTPYTGPGICKHVT